MQQKPLVEKQIMNSLPSTDNTLLQQNKQPLIAALYARVSTNRQEEQETISSQVDEIKRKISEDGNIIHPDNIFIDDGWTGEMLQRPSLDKMRDAAIAGDFEVLYVYDRGRLSRVFAYQEIILEEIIDKGIKFVTLHDVQAVTPEERVLQAMQGVFHEYERVKIAERMRRGKLFKAKSGVLINGSALYGYKYFKKSDKEPAHYEVNEEEARVVRMIYQWIGVEKVSMREAIKRLYDMGITPRKGKSEFWTKGPLLRILQCETYTKGVVYYNKSEAVVAKKPIKNDKYKKVKRSSRKQRPREEWIPFNVPKIIEDEGLYETIQKILKNNQKFACKPRKYNYLLSGLVFCECGSPRVGDGIDGRNFYYRCAQRIYKFPLKNKCKVQGMNAVALDTSLWKELVAFLKNPNLIKKQAEEWLRLQIDTDVDKQEKERLANLIDKSMEEEKRYAKAYGEGTLEFEQFRELMRDAKKKRLLLEEELNSLNIKINHEGIDLIQLEELIEEAKRVIKSLNFDNKFQLIRDIIDRCIVKGGNTVEVIGHLPLFAVNMGYEPISWDCRSSKRW